MSWEIRKGFVEKRQRHEKLKERLQRRIGAKRMGRLRRRDSEKKRAEHYLRLAMVCPGPVGKRVNTGCNVLKQLQGQDKGEKTEEQPGILKDCQ